MRKEGFEPSAARFKPSPAASCSRPSTAAPGARQRDRHHVDANQATRCRAEGMEYWSSLTASASQRAVRIRRGVARGAASPERIRASKSWHCSPYTGVCGKELALRESMICSPTTATTSSADACSPPMSQVRRSPCWPGLQQASIPHTWSISLRPRFPTPVCAGIPNCDWFETPNDPSGWNHELNFGSSKSPRLRDG